MKLREKYNTISYFHSVPYVFLEISKSQHFRNILARVTLKNYKNEFHISHPSGIYLFKVKNRNTSTMYEICSKLTIKTLEGRY